MAELKRTPQQQMAVDSEGGALLVSAAAGSGKTKVLVDRLMRKICDPNDPKDINNFLIITYTKAAAAELRGKIANAIGTALSEEPNQRHLQRQLSRIYQAQISTVHSFCASILRDYAHELGIYPDFRVAEEQETALWKEQAMEETLQWAYASIEAQPDCAAFLNRLGAGRDDRRAESILMDAYRAVGCHPDPEGWMKQCIDGLSVTQCQDISETLWGRFLMEDFQLILTEQISAMERGLTRLSENPIVEEKYAPTFRENLEQLRRLHAASTWDELRERRIDSLGRLGVVRGQDKEELDRFKRPRAQCSAWLKKEQEVFSQSSEEALEEIEAQAPIIRGMFTLVKEFTARYQAIKQRRRVLDFGDLEHEALRLLRYPGSGAPTPAAKEIGSRFCEIMVDEFQDSNAVQDAIFTAISKNGSNLFMVGDVKQSIYRFRLADPGIFLRKYHAYPDAEKAKKGEARRVVLSKNFRSRPEILSAVNDIFRRCMSEAVGDLSYGEQEALYPGAQLPPMDGNRVELHCLDTSEKDQNADKRALEARLVAKRVRALLNEGAQVTGEAGLRPAKPSDIVVLLRSVHSQAQLYLDAFRAVGIEAVSDQSDDILSTTELSVLLSYLEILDNPHQDIPLLSVLLSPVFGFSPAQAAQVRENRRSCDFYEALCADAEEHDTFVPFLRQLDALRTAAAQESAGTVVRMVCEQTGLRDVFSAMPDGSQRLENIQTLYLLAASFDPDGAGRLHDFLLNMERQRERGLSGAGTKNPNAVRLMSIHKSKGLEFPIVIVAGLAGKFNTEDDRQSALIHPRLGTGCDVVDTQRRIRYPSLAKQAVLKKQRQERMSEELRVLYVALTRPKDLLIMTYASASLKTKLQGIADQVSEDGPVSLARQADSIGYWVLMAALCRAEAGELFALGGRPDDLQMHEHPWRIRLWTPQELPEPQAVHREHSAEQQDYDPALAKELLSFRYPHQAAICAPAKLTATQLKGRFLDHETAQGAPEEKPREKLLRQPLFLQGQRPLRPNEQGTAVHLAMQYISYEACMTEDSVREELKRLTEAGFLQEQQAQCVLPQTITALFRSPLGERIRRASQVIREFKFSLLVDGGEYDAALCGEQIMLQGVTDCCLMEEDGLCVIDFKTDRITPGQEANAAQRYRGQLEAYSSALSKIFDCPVKERILYFFSTGTAYSL